MYTKLDHRRDQEKERAIREKNLKELDGQIEEARYLIDAIAKQPQCYETESEMRVVRASLRELEALRADEKKAYDATFAADDDSITRAVNAMRL